MEAKWTRFIRKFNQSVKVLRFWAKIMVGSIWAVVASIIANIIFQVFAK